MESNVKPGACRLGVTMMDRDHSEIHGMIAELKWIAAAHAPSERTSSLLRELSRASASHFALEETMMEATRYPGTQIHRLRHRWMIDQLRSLSGRLRRNRLQPDHPLVELIAESHHAHVWIEDLNYAWWLNAR
jgi:hemerythrin-like metal-binding protein